eukprot:gene15907-4806_t
MTIHGVLESTSVVGGAGMVHDDISTQATSVYITDAIDAYASNITCNTTVVSGQIVYCDILTQGGSGEKNAAKDFHVTVYNTDEKYRN